MKSKVEKKPNGVKCMIYGCGFEWYKGRPMTDQELLEHRCIHMFPSKTKVENGEVIEKEIERIILGYFTSFFDLGEAKSSYNSRTNEYHNNIPLERAVSEMKAFITNALNQQRVQLEREVREKTIADTFKKVNFDYAKVKKETFNFLIKGMKEFLTKLEHTR